MSSCPHQGTCYQWTLVINDGEYTGAKADFLPPSSTTRSPTCVPSLDPVTSEIMNATVGKVYIKDSGSDNKDTLYNCTLNTVYCVLMDAFSYHNNDT